MQYEFIKQQRIGGISTGDEIELYNCEDRQMNGNYIVGMLNTDTGDATLIGTGDKGGYVTVITFGE